MVITAIQWQWRNQELASWVGWETISLFTGEQKARQVWAQTLTELRAYAKKHANAGELRFRMVVLETDLDVPLPSSWSLNGADDPVVRVLAEWPDE